MKMLVATVLVFLVVLIPSMMVAVLLLYNTDLRPGVPVVQPIYTYSRQENYRSVAGEWLIELADTMSGTRIQKRFRGQLMVGRSMGNVEPPGWLYIAPDQTISRRQFRLMTTLDGIYVENMSGTNLTRVNGIALRNPSAIFPGDFIGVGGRQFVVTDLRQCA